MILGTPDPIIISALLSISVAVLHGIGLRLIRRTSCKIRSERYQIVYPSFVMFSLMLLHLLEMQIFALGFLAVGVISDPEDAFYVSASLYTTRGRGAEAIDPNWSLLAQAEQWVGTAMFLWSIIFIISIRRDLFSLNGAGEESPN